MEGALQALKQRSCGPRRTNSGADFLLRHCRLWKVHAQAGEKYGREGVEGKNFYICTIPSHLFLLCYLRSYRGVGVKLNVGKGEERYYFNVCICFLLPKTVLTWQ